MNPWPVERDTGGCPSGESAYPVPGWIWILAALALMCMLCEGVRNDWSALEARNILGATAATALAGPSLIGWMTRLIGLNYKFLLPALLVVAVVAAGILRTGCGREFERGPAHEPESGPQQEPEPAHRS